MLSPGPSCPPTGPEYRLQAPTKRAAVDAVRQWELSQTLLNGVAVEVAMRVTVNFIVD